MRRATGGAVMTSTTTNYEGPEGPNGAKIKDERMLSGGVGPRTVHNSLLMLSFLCKHARRFKWIPANPYGEVRKPKFRVKVRAFTAAEVATLTGYADDATRVLIQTAAHTGLRMGELAGLEWRCVDLERGGITLRSSLRTKPGRT